MSIKVIGAGFPRTGTNSLKRCLEMLGISRCYHMKELLVNPDQLPLWLELENTGTTNWEQLYDGFQGTVDFPCYPFYRQHLEKYPEAKVILTIRDFDCWYKSVKSTVWTAGPQNLGQKLVMLGRMISAARVRKVVNCVGFVKRMLWQKQFHGRFEDPAFAQEIFNQHIEDVKANVPADQLLVYDIREGWGPLCQFLGVSEPSEELPHLNKRETFKTMMQSLIKTGKMVEV
ncbi:MAG: hypothetical protein DHS20C17_20530 [Cyclobacteriaceae bacterium]|nr:MAG: hypothetical protein DHS20C17_20530 [Cyclobacteriaceae bacterium]